MTMHTQIRPRFGFAPPAQSVYASTARFDNQARAVTEDELRRLAPSVFAETPHESRSDRFRAIPTIDILRGLAKEGFSVVGAKQSGTRNESKREFTKHLIRMRRLDDGKTYGVGDVVPEMLLKNANDGSAGYELMAGLFRVRCLNSLVAQVGTFDHVTVRHSGDVQSKVIEGTYRVLSEAQKALAAPDAWSQLRLSAPEKAAFADAAHVLRFGDAEGNVKTPVQPEQLLRPRRMGDTEADLWTTFNVVQENVLRGGLHAVGRDANGARRRTTTRAVNGIDQDVKLNKALWIVAQAMATQRGVSIAA